MMNNKGIAKLLNLIGIGLLVMIIVILLPLTLPRVFGYDIYGILSNSMEPSISTGSVIYVEKVDASQIKVNDIITFKMDSQSDVVATHRVVKINDDQSFVTKGDHNKTEDAMPVNQKRLIGRSVMSIPFLGYISQYLFSDYGIALIIVMFSLTILCWIEADYFKNKNI